LTLYIGFIYNAILERRNGGRWAKKER